MKRTKTLFLLLLALCAAGLSAQKKEFTLSDALLSPGKYYPERYAYVQWAPNGARWAHYDTTKGELLLETPAGAVRRITSS